MYDITKLLPQKQFDSLVSFLPTPKQKKEGRRRCSKWALVNGILQVLVNGVTWGKIAECGCSYISCYRYFKELQRRGKLKHIYKALSHSNADLVEGSIDTTTIPSFEFSYGVGWNGHKHIAGTKLSLFADKNGRPADVLFGKASKDDRSFLSDHIRNTFGKVKKVLNLNMMYMGLQVRRTMRRHGIKVNMKIREQDYRRKRGPKFRFDKENYNLRFLVERLNGWLKNFKRIRIRQEYHVASFKAFVYLALIIILIRY